MITVSVFLPDYLAQWAIYRLENTRDQDRAVILPAKGSPIAQFLRNFLRHKRHRPDLIKPEGQRGAVKEGIVETFIAVPHFPGRDPNYFNYLSPTAEAQLRDLIRSRFDIQLFTEFSRFKNVEIPTNEFIYSWLDANGIEQSERNWLAVEKRLQLLRRRANDRNRKSNKLP